MQPYDDSATTMEPTTEAPAAAAAAPAPQPVTTAAAALPPKKVAKPVPAAPPEYQMPSVRLGQPVLWRPDPGEEGELPGFAVKLGPNSICVMVIVEGSGAPVQIRDGARHITDPRWSRDAGEGGVWQHTEVDRELYEALEELGDAFGAQGILLTGLVETVAELRAQVAELETKPCTWATAEQLAEQQKRIDALSMASNPMPISEAIRKVDLADVLKDIPETPPVQGPPPPPAKPHKHANR